MSSEIGRRVDSLDRRDQEPSLLTCLSPEMAPNHIQYRVEPIPADGDHSKADQKVWG